jgi:hypothetical protein
MVGDVIGSHGSALEVVQVVLDGVLDTQGVAQVPMRSTCAG